MKSFKSGMTYMWAMAMLVIAISTILAGCDGYALKQERRMKDFAPNQGDYNEIAQATFHLLDPDKKIHLWLVTSAIQPEAVLALKRMGNVATYISPPAGAHGTLAAGQFIVSTFTVGNGEALIEGQLGPVTNEITAAGLPDCGTMYSAPWFIQGGEWHSPSIKIMTCAESRHWTPVDPPKSTPHDQNH